MSSSSSSELRSVVHQRLLESGEKDRIKELLRSRLIESGWRDNIKIEARNIVKRNFAILLFGGVFITAPKLDKLFTCIFILIKIEIKFYYLFSEKGLEKVKLDDLVKEITPKGRSTVPDAVKRELLAKIKDFLAQQQNI